MQLSGCWLCFRFVLDSFGCSIESFLGLPSVTRALAIAKPDVCPYAG